ncbi:phosphoribosylglycinamide formyltransferase [Candidatus Erwinia haradaeae]|uniref:Phosphoribosylglycinamide formyltransferase n=1 Tax=Candidatus Erwinia haradaeae TaxID=1922217 RepID=A0A451DJS9_9GAMM|nr:phosphoribosylglycinamide formyltransferase [Candidatus Erwinia haradaeae]VFP86937.1 Phosphoribosylglycinamide formyltransferase [Candidatus Erwinia haradaeae]
MKQIVILVSGYGTNLQAILNAHLTTEISSKIAAVISNNSNAFAIKRAELAHVATHIIEEERYKKSELFNKILIKTVKIYNPDLIVLAGYMRILNIEFVTCYTGKILNIHPSLLPKYPGLKTHQRAIENGEKQHGTSIHFVTEQIDNGPIILQVTVPIFYNDTEHTLKMRVKYQENIIYPRVIKWFIDGRLEMHENSAWLDGRRLPHAGYKNPINKK